MIAGLACGSRSPLGWAYTKDEMDFYDLKGDLELILSIEDGSDEFEFEMFSLPSLHPGQTAQIIHNGQSVGLIGRLHPQIEADFSINKAVYLFELDVDKIAEVNIPKAQDISKFPEIRRDLAFTVDLSVTADQLLRVAKNAAGDNLSKLKLFDVYQSKDLENKGKSIALGLTFQHSSRTLTDNEINQSIDDVIDSLGDQLNAKLRN